jgi:phosphatidylinositol phospholipase C, delta
MGLGFGGKNSKSAPAKGDKGGKGGKGDKEPATKKGGSASKEPATKKGGKEPATKKGGDAPKKATKGDAKKDEGKNEIDQAGGHEGAFTSSDDGTVTKKCNKAEWQFYKTLNKHSKLKPFCPKLVKVIGKEKDEEHSVQMGDLTAGYEKPCILDIKMGVTSAAPDADKEKKKSMEAKDKSTTTVSLGIRIVGMKVYNHEEKKWIKHDKPWGKALTDDTINDGILEFFDTGDKKRDWRQDVVAPFTEQLLLIQKHFRKQTDLQFISSSLLFVYDAVGDAKCVVKMIDFAHVFPLSDGEHDEGYLTGLKNLLPVFEGMVAGNKVGGGKDEASDTEDEAEAGVAAAQLTDDEIKEAWKQADKDGDGTLSFKEVKRLLGKLNVKKPEKYVKTMFNEVDADNSKELDFDEFKHFLELLRMRQEIIDIFEAHGADPAFWTPKELAKFVSDVQGEPMKEKEAKALITKLEPDSNGEKLNVTGFAAYLYSPACSGLSAEHREVSQDMTQPMAHYWLASSHNTYLLGDQLKGESSIQAYINTFEKSCRCVELDCWDNPKDMSMPIIYHGHTLTSKITFEDVIKTIRDYAFKHTDYPIILSLEVHCNEEGQRAMAKIITDILGEADMIPESFEGNKRCPPPSELKRKVLLKGKMLAWDDDEDEDPEDRAKTLAAIAEAEAGADDKKGKGKGKKGGKDEKAEGGAGEEKKDKKKKGAIAKELSDLVHLKAVHFKDFADSKENGKAWEMSSFAEGKMIKITEGDPAGFADYNTRQLSRIYPKGMRIDSSNYDPVPAWNSGSQIVALNYQTGADEMWINDGKFLGNGRSGYILKPENMRGDSSEFDHRTKADVAKTLVITVVSGWQIPKGQSEKAEGEIIDPYVSIAVHGVKADKKRIQTKTIKNNGFNPVWEPLTTDKKQPKKKKNVFEFPLTQPELAILLFKVYDEDLLSSNDFIAQYSCSATHIGAGYRSLPLKNEDGKVYKNSSILVHVAWK